MIGRLVCLLALLMGVSPLSAEETKDPDPRDVSLTGESSDTEDALKRLRNALLPIHPQPKQRPTFIGETGKNCVLYGDLFQNGEIYALATLGDEEIGSGFAQWMDDRWEPRNLWKITPVWKPKGWEKTKDEYFPITPAERPFWVMDFNEKGALGIVIAGEVWRYWQEHKLFWLDPKKHHLKCVESAMHAPALKDGFLVLPYDSGHRSIFTEFRYMKWKDEKFEEQAAWRDETPYDGGKPHFFMGSRRQKNGKSQRFAALDKNIDVRDWCYVLEKDDQPFGEIAFKLKDVKADDLNNVEGLLQAFLFEKFTGLPRRLFPSELKSQKKLEDCAEVIVTGNDAAKKLLVPGKRRQP